MAGAPVVCGAVGWGGRARARSSAWRSHDFIPREVIENFRAILGHDNHVFHSHPSLSLPPFATFDGKRHAFLEDLGMLQGPLPVDDWIFVLIQTDPVSHFHGQYFEFVFVAPLRSR